MKWDFEDLTQLNWGSVTPDFSKDGEFVHVVNHSLTTPLLVKDTVDFIIGRIQWCEIYLKAQVNHVVEIDDIGQTVTEEARSFVRDALKPYAFMVTFLSEAE